MGHLPVTTPTTKTQSIFLPQQISLSMAPSHWVCVGLMKGGTAAASLWVWRSHVQRTALPSTSHLNCYYCLLCNSLEVLLLLWMFSCENLIRKQFFFSWLPIIFPLQSDEKLVPCVCSQCFLHLGVIVFTFCQFLCTANIMVVSKIEGESLGL